MKLIPMTLVAATLAALPMQAAILVNSSSFNYTQNFDTLANSGSPTWANDSTIPGWFLYRQPAPGTAITSYLPGTGSVNTGSFYSFGAAASSERALGGVGSAASYFGAPAQGAVAGWIAAAFQNTSGSPISSLTVKIDGEQWRNGGGGSPTAQTMALQYGFGATFGAVPTWSAAGAAFNWVSPVVSSTAAAVNGNVAGKVPNVGGNLTTPWNPGSTLWLRWVENNDVGDDHGMAIDNFSLSVGVVPEAGTWGMAAGALMLVAALRGSRKTARKA